MERPTANILVTALREILEAHGIIWKEPVGEETDALFAMGCGILLGENVTLREKIVELEGKIRSMERDR